MIDSPHSPPHFPFSPPSEWKPPARGWWCKPQSPPGSAANARPPWRARFLQRLKFNRWLGGHGGATAFQMGEVVENLLCPSHENTASSHVEKTCFRYISKTMFQIDFGYWLPFFIIVTVIVILHYPLAASGIPLNIPKLDNKRVFLIKQQTVLGIGACTMSHSRHVWGAEIRRSQILTMVP